MEERAPPFAKRSDKPDDLHVSTSQHGWSMRFAINNGAVDIEDDRLLNSRDVCEFFGGHFRHDDLALGAQRTAGFPAAIPIGGRVFRRLSDCRTFRIVCRRRREDRAKSRVGGPHGRRPDPGNETAAEGVGTQSGGELRRRVGQFSKANSTETAPHSASTFALLDAGNVVAIFASADALRSYLVGGAA